MAWLVVGYRYHFLDGVNLVFHEAGHLFLRPFGQTLHFLGGTLAQLFFPAACVYHFLRQGQRFEAAICGIWLAESGMYMAAYLGDAAAMSLPLVGGHIHDWNFLLSRWGLLGACRPLALVLHGMASLGAVYSLVVAARLVFEKGAEAASPAPEPFA